MLVIYILFIVGLILIIKGGDYFVDSACSIARFTGLPEVLIGATLVSIATTLPETTVSVVSAVSNYPTIAMGNAIGSIVCNTGLILGLYHIFKPSKVRSRVFNFKIMLLTLYLLVLWVMSMRGYIDTAAGMILLAMLFGYLCLDLLFIGYKWKSNKTKNKKREREKFSFSSAMKFIVGITFILVGSRLLVNNGIMIAKHLGVSEAVIALTIIALGTSLPELVTAISSFIKGHDDISVGNILGANILNVALVLGLSSMFANIKVSIQNLSVDIPVAIFMTAGILLPSVITRKISRFQGLLLLVSYVTYIAFLVYKNNIVNTFLEMTKLI